MKRILFYIQLPPPVHGVSAMNQLCYDVIRRCGCLKSDLLEISYSTTIDELGKTGIKKLVKAITHVIRFIHKLIAFRPDYIYMSPMPSGVGFMRDAIFMLLIRICRIRPIYHLHGVGIAKGLESGKIMNHLYHLCFKGGTVIALSGNLLKNEILDAGFKECRTFILPNAIRDINTWGIIRANLQEPLNIVFLSNLRASKGILIFWILLFCALMSRYQRTLM